jgi:hypothetical protein
VSFQVAQENPLPHPSPWLGHHATILARSQKNTAGGKRTRTTNIQLDSLGDIPDDWHLDVRKATPAAREQLERDDATTPLLIEERAGKYCLRVRDSRPLFVVDDATSHQWNDEHVTALKQAASSDNFVSWGTAEGAPCSEYLHPVNFWEQRAECPHCGAQKFIVGKQNKCCSKGQLLLNHRQEWPAEAVELFEDIPSKQSRNLNNMFKFGQFCLPKGCDLTKHGGFFTISGQPWRQVSDMNMMNNSTCSFISDPAERRVRLNSAPSATMPSRRHEELVKTMMERDNVLVSKLQNWARVTNHEERRGRAIVNHIPDKNRFTMPTRSEILAQREDITRDAFLVLETNGDSTTVEMVSVRPSTAGLSDRIVFFSNCGDVSNTRTVNTSNHMYIPMFYALTNPRGKAMNFETMLTGSGADSAKSILTNNNTTLMQYIQPIKLTRQGGSEDIYNRKLTQYLTYEVDYPQGTVATPQRFRFSPYEIYGRLGDEFLIDGFLRTEDALLRQIASERMQKRLKGEIKNKQYS